jgi:hypothetical protein
MEMIGMIVQGQAVLIEALQELNKPKKSAIKIEKQADGSYVGVKEES